MRIHGDAAHSLWTFLDHAPAVYVHCLTKETLRALLRWNDANGDYPRSMPAADLRAALVLQIIGSR